MIYRLYDALGNTVAERVEAASEEEALEARSGAVLAEQWLLVSYYCDGCNYEWDEEWTSACDDECPLCFAECSPENWEGLTNG